jgi:hypothetical protein
MIRSDAAQAAETERAAITDPASGESTGTSAAANSK